MKVCLADYQKPLRRKEAYMPAVTGPKYGILNTKNFQQLINDCLTDAAFKSEVIGLLRSSVYTFFSKFFDLHPAA